jgi:hypothetical protein
MAADTDPGLVGGIRKTKEYAIPVLVGYQILTGIPKTVLV